MEQNFFNTYYQELLEAYKSGSPSVRYNSDRAHNAVIMCFMFDHSDEVNMYCGQMSVLREGFYSKINENNGMGDSNLGNEIMSHLQESLDGFLTREGTRLNILFETYSSSYMSDLVSKESMHVAIAKEKLKMRVLPEDFALRKTLDHFSVSDKGMFRFEDDKEQHSAICSFNDHKSTSRLLVNFQILNSMGRTV